MERIVKQGQLSKNFYRKEFTCKCGCGYSTIDAELIRVLEEVRELLGRHEVVILSGCRCPTYNTKVQGARSSFHKQGKAADFFIRDVELARVADCLEDIYSDRYGVIRYDGFVHLDVRDGFYREDKRSAQT